MLYIYNTNKIELISEIIAKELLLNPPFVTEKINISAHNFFLSKWIRDQITKINGISTLYEFQTITAFTEGILEKVFPENRFICWNYESIKWNVINHLSDLHEYNESWPIKNWINKFIESKQIINQDIYKLASKISKMYTEYILYRPEIIYKWDKTNLNSKNLFNGLNKDQFWQPILYKLIEKDTLTKPNCIYIQEIINNINKFSYKFKEIFPNDIYIIAINNLSKLQIDFYSEISKFINVKLFILFPGDDLWKRINIIETKEVNYINNKNFSQTIRIEKIFGKYGANFQKLIEETIFEKEVKSNIKNIYVDPTIYLNKSQDKLLLHQIQKKIINNNFNLIRSKNDNSFIFRGLNNLLEELKFIKNSIIQIKISCKDINYNDIMIVTPNLNNLKPYLKYVFNSEIKLPYFIATDNFFNSFNVYNLLLNLLDISSNKFTLNDLREFLSYPITQLIFDFKNNEKEEILNLLIESGFDWGIDSKERHHEFENSLDWCIERIILGIMYEHDFYLKEKRLKPYLPKNTNIDINKWIMILIKFKGIINLLRSTNSYDNWVLIIKNILSGFKNINDVINTEIDKINESLKNYSNFVDSKICIEINVLKEILKKCFENKNNNLDRRKDEILISDIEKTRLIPHKVIYLINMNEDYYPRKFRTEHNNLINNKYIFGDPSAFDKEIYLFLELLISCRFKFVVTWSNYDNNFCKLGISPQVRQLISFIENNIDKIPKNNLVKNIKNLDYFLINNEKNYPENIRNGFIKSFDWNENSFKNKTYKISELIHWFRTPQLYWLNNKSIYPKTKFNHNYSDELISNYQKFKLINDLLKKAYLDKQNFNDEITNLDIKEQLIMSGIITPGNSIFIRELEINELIKSFNLNMEEYKKINKIYLKSNLNKVEYLICNNHIVEIFHSKLNLAKKCEIWIRLLFASSLQNNISKTHVIYRNDSKYRKLVLNTQGKVNATKILTEYIDIYKNFLQICLPLPPESSFKYVDAIIKNKDPEKAFTESWLGNSNFFKGENSNPEMQLCFGSEKDPEFFLRNKNLQKLSLRLYKPLIEAFEK